MDVVDERLAEVTLVILQRRSFDRLPLWPVGRGNRDDGGQAQASAAAVAKKLLGAATQWDEVPRYLVTRHNFDVNFRASASGMTPLMEATRFGHVFGVELLMELRADPQQMNARGHTALDIARSKVSEYLDFQEMQCSENRLTAVEECIARDRQRIADLLIRGC